MEAHVSHIDGSRVEGHFLVLLGVVQRKINFPILLGAGGKVIFSYCGGGSHFSHIVGNRSKVAFLILLEVESGRWNFCWVESHVSHIVGSRLGSTRFSYCLESGSHCCELSAGKSIFPQYN